MSRDIPQFSSIAERMRAEGLPEPFIDSFAEYYGQLVKGETGLIPEDAITPVESLPDLEKLDPILADIGARALHKTVLIKLNGGLGTSMGLERAKSLLPVREGLSFLDIIARQALCSNVPLLLMNSFSTEDDSLEALESYNELGKELPLSFVQHKEPKIAQSDLRPVSWPTNPALEWCPPGHGDIYIALVTSGALERLLEAGYKYAFVSNSDNLGAALNPVILGYMVQEQVPFMMEVADRTEMDKKGGHLARNADGQLILREAAQCPSEDMDAFQDVTRHRYFNTNNLWFNLRGLKGLMKSRDNKLGLPMIRNSKTVDPRDKASTPVYQIETAMGAAIAVFDGAEALRVPRTRFAPVKTTNELLAVRSDAFVMTDNYQIVPSPERRLPPLLITLDSTYYKLVSDFEARFPHGAPSLIDCSSLEVKGDYKFGKDVICKGDVRLVNANKEQVLIQDGVTVTSESI
jgi:UTP--glucose-1-phosphate uridylyltransferase